MKTTRMVAVGFGALVFLGGAIIAGANLWKSGLVVRTVLVQGNRVVETNEILQLANIDDGMRLYDLDLLQIRNDVSSHYFLKDAVVERDPPSTIRITVTERVPVAMINTGEIRFLDSEGVVLPHTVSGEVFDLPYISGLAPGLKTAVGIRLDHPDVAEALSIINAAAAVSPELPHLLSEIRLRPGGDVVLYTAEGGVPVLFGRGGAATKLLLLETFWNTVVRERGPGTIRYIDVRFVDQVVVQWKQGRETATQRS